MDDHGAVGQVGLWARLLGRVKLMAGGREVPDSAWERRSSRYLLLFLLSSPGHRVSRDVAMEALWPNASMESATRALYVAIHGLRRVLEPEITSGRASRYVDLSGDVVRLVPGSVEWLDVAAFEAALDAGGDRKGQLAQALQFYGGDLLEEEPYLDWPAARRERLRWRWRETVLEYADLERQAGRPMLAVPSIERVLEADPADEVAYRALMVAYAEAGRKEDALEVFERCSAALESELGAAPTEETRELSESIRQRPAAAPSVPVVSRMDSLPRPANPIVGRGREIEELFDLVCQPDTGLVTVTGTGGLGKTRIALEVASLAKDEFEHGVCFVPLADIRDASLVVRAVAQSLGIEDVPARTPLEQMRERLRDAEMLLVIDNVEQVLDSAVDLAAILDGCSRVTMLVTSRVPLRVRAEHDFPLEPLAVPNIDRPISLGRAERYPSMELFAQRASAVRRSFALNSENVEAIAQVCARLDGLPLAIELAAARVRDMQPRELIEGLTDRFELLSGGYRDMPPRHQTMRAAIAWSYELMQPAEQRLVRRLAVFDGGFGVDAAVSVSGGGARRDVVSLLSSLKEQGLIQLRDESDERRFWMFETIREFARDLLHSHGEHEEAATAHASWYVSFSEDAAPGMVGTEQGVWFERVETELANIRAAMTFLLRERSGGEDALRLSAGVWRYWRKAGRPEEGLRLIQRALDHGSEVRTESRARALFAAGELAEVTGRYENAEQMCGEALEIFRAFGNEPGEADTLDSLGILARNRGDLDRSEKVLQESLAIHRRLGNRRGMASALNGLGAVAYYRGDADTTDRCWSEAVELVRAIGDDRSLISILGNLSALATMREELDRALAIGEEVLERARRIGDANNVTISLTNLGAAHYERGDLSLAERYFREALEGGREQGLVQVEATMLFNLAKVAYGQGDVDEAVRLYSESLGIFHSTGNAHGVASCLEELGGIAVERGEDRTAVRWLAVSDTLREEKGISREPVDHGEVAYQTRLETIRERLGDVEFDRLWTEAIRLDMNAVVSDLLESADAPPSLLP